MRSPRIVSTVFAAAMLMISLPLFSLSPTVSTRFHNSIDIAGFGSCAWGKGNPAPNHEVELLIREQVESQLKAKGYALTADPAECRLTSQAIRHEGFPLGTLLIEIYDGGSGALAWQGKATELTNYDLKQIKKKVRKIIKTMFKDFPKAR